MRKVKLTKLGEVWCSAGKPFCGNCTSECGNYHFIDCDEETKEFELCKYAEDSKCMNKDSAYYGWGCGYDVVDMELCSKYTRDEKNEM